MIIWFNCCRVWSSPHPLIMFGGYGYPAGSFEQSYQCYPASFIDKPQLENGDKVILPPSALDHLASLQIDYPMLFELYNAATERRSHCGVLEFTADEGMIYMPYWMMQNMLLQEGDIVRVKNATLPKGTYVKLQPHTKDFLDISNPKAVLETTLRNFSCLTTNDSIMVSYNNRYYYLDVIDTKPSSAISIMDTDCELDIALPLDYKESTSVLTASCTPLSGSTISQETKEATRPKFIPFTGIGRRLDGKTTSYSTTPITSSQPNNSTPHSTNSKSSMPRSIESIVAKNPSKRLMFGSDANNSLPKDSLKEVAKDEAQKDPSKFQAFTGKRYLLK